MQFGFRKIVGCARRPVCKNDASFYDDPIIHPVGAR
jgi:hypothetical protein